MTRLTNSHVSDSIGTTGTAFRDKRVARGRRSRSVLLAAGLVLGACGGESKSADDTSGSDDSGAANSTGNTSAGNASSSSATGATTGSSSGSSTTSSGNGAGGNSNASNTSANGTSSGNSGGSGGLGGAGGSAGATASCEPQDVAGVGACDAAFGVFFVGAACGWVSGCSCVGEDCANGYDDEAECEQAYRGCLDECAPQDIALVGGCEPASVYVFNGSECVAMDGCDCVGEDCDAAYASPEACQAANAACADRDHTCEGVEDLYVDYVGHAACTDDSDCMIVTGHCGIGVGGCYHAVNRGWGQAGLDAIAEAWAATGCTGPVCDCGPPPDGAYCGNGVCTLPQP